MKSQQSNITKQLWQNKNALKTVTSKGTGNWKDHRGLGKRNKRPERGDAVDYTIILTPNRKKQARAKRTKHEHRLDDHFFDHKRQTSINDKDPAPACSYSVPRYKTIKTGAVKES
jgi:hypothetical protein